MAEMKRGRSQFCFDLGVALQERRDFEKALAWFNQAIELHPEIQWAHLRRGDAYVGLGQYDRAIADFDIAFTHLPERFIACRNRGKVYAILKQYDKALENYEQCFTKNPTDSRTWEPYLVLQLKVHGVEQYRTSCQKLVVQTADVTDPETANLVARACVIASKAVGDFQPCVALARRAVDQAPNNPEFRHTLGTTLYRAGDYDGAVQSLDEAIRLRRNDGRWCDWLFLAMAHHHLGHSDDAQRWLEKVDKLMKEDAASRAKRAEEIGLSLWYHQLELELLHAEAEEIIKPKKQ
jgi:tetratricopeptide (TPR) repeat protein